MNPLISPTSHQPQHLIAALQSMEALRLDIMDAQRFDISKRRSRRPDLSIETKSTTGQDESPTVTSPPNSGPNSPAISICGPWMHHAPALLPLPLVSSAPADADTDTSSTSAISESLSSSSATATPSSQTSPSSITVVDHAVTTEIHQTDVFVNDEFITTRTIIRPIPQSPIMACLSRPSSPCSRPASPISRPSSPFNINFGTLNCFGSTDAFEDELDQIQIQRLKESAGIAGVKVVVTKERSVHREELWRAAVQEVLYGNGNDGIRRRRGSSAQQAV